MLQNFVESAKLNSTCSVRGPQEPVSRAGRQQRRAGPGQGSIRCVPETETSSRHPPTGDTQTLEFPYLYVESEL